MCDRTSAHTQLRLLFLSQPSPSAEAFGYSTVEDGQLFRTNGATLEVVFTPGHTTDHVAFVLREEKVILCVSSLDRPLVKAMYHEVGDSA